jgi:iron(III) transport system permease protein
MKFKSLSFFLFLVTFFFFLGISIFPLILLFFSLVKKNNDFFQALSSVDFQSLFHKEGRQFLLLQRSFYLATCTTFFSVLLGATFAWILAKYRFRGRFLFFILLLLPAFIPSYIQALLWNNVLGVKGVVNLWLAQYSYPPLLLVGPRLYGCCFVLTLSLYPYPFLLCYQHFMQMDGHQEESIQLYFKHPLQRFSFYFRSVFPTLQVTGLLVFLLASSNLGVPQVLNVQVYPLEIFTQYSAFLNYSAATLVSLPQIVLSLLLLYFLFRKENLSPQSGKSSTPALFFKRTPIFWIASLGLSLFVLTTQILPFGTLVYKIRSFQWLQKALENAGAELLTTLKLALGTATLFTLLSLILGSFFAKRFFFTPPFQKITSFAFWLCLLPLVLPGILLATGMVYLWVSFNSIYLSIWILIFGATRSFCSFWYPCHGALF